MDKAAFAKVVWSGYEDPSDSPIPPNLAFHVAQQPWPYDPAKAKQLLAQAGVGDGFETEIWANTTTISLRAMQFLQQQLGAVGVKVKVTPLEAGLLDAKIWSVQKPEDSQLQLYTGAWSSSTGDADWGLRPLFWTQAFPPKLYQRRLLQQQGRRQGIWKMRWRPPIRRSAPRSTPMRRSASGTMRPGSSLASTEPVRAVEEADWPLHDPRWRDLLIEEAALTA